MNIASDEKNLVWHELPVRRKDRNRLNEHASGLIWFTGLSGAGKSSIAGQLEKVLHNLKIRTYILDGDNVRHGLNSNLGFSREDRKENIRRVAETGKLFVDAGIVVMATFISPYEEDRMMIRKCMGRDNFIEVYVRCSLNICELRDPKGAYKKARAGLIKDFTGISSPYEEPGNPDLVIDTEALTLDQSVDLLFEFIKRKGFLAIR